MNLFKWLKVPTGATKDVKAYESWIVRYKSAVEFCTTGVMLREQAEVFTTEENAKDYVEQLKAAHKFLKCTYYMNIKIEKN